MGFLDEVICAALAAKASSAQSQSPQSAPVEDPFSQIAAVLQEPLAPKHDGGAQRPTVAQNRRPKLQRWPKLGRRSDGSSDEVR
jgi:hypothetical protein